MTAQLYSSIFYVLFLFFVLPFSVLTSVILKMSVTTGINAYVIVSNSMNPSIPIGSVIYTKKETVYKIGDIVVYPQKGKTISHRIDDVIKIGSQIYYSTKGDANTTSDFDLVERGIIFGKTVFFLPYIGEIILALRNQNLILLGAVLPTLLFLRIGYKALRF